MCRCVVGLINGNDVSSSNVSVLYSQMTVSNFGVEAKYPTEDPICTYSPPLPKQMPVSHLKLSHGHFLPTPFSVHYLFYHIHVALVLRTLVLRIFTLTFLADINHFLI